MKIKFFYIDAGIHPKLGRVYHWQKKMIGEGDLNRYNRYICNVLGAVAQTPAACNEILKFIDDVENDIYSDIEVGGNDVTLKIGKFGVQVDIEINENWIGQEDGRFELSEWKSVLRGWQQFLEMPQSLDTVVEVEL